MSGYQKKYQICLIMYHGKNVLLKFIRKKLQKLKDTKYFRRLVFDEIFANFLLSSNIRSKIKKIKKKNKILN